ncbi:hypothetical protein BDR07DRAFT_1434110 [Suillus spraguei]|nr:hypothetical protein BDR07DRAFT_1434110 [Suillus spraguei]
MANNCLHYVQWPCKACHVHRRPAFFSHTSASSLLDRLLFGSATVSFILFQMEWNVFVNRYERFHFYSSLSSCWHDLHLPFSPRPHKGPHGDRFFVSSAGKNDGFSTYIPCYMYFTSYSFDISVHAMVAMPCGNLG